MLHANFMALRFTEQELLPVEVFIAGIGILDLFCCCDLDLGPMTFICDTDGYFFEMYRMCENEPPTSRLSKAIV